MFPGEPGRPFLSASVPISPSVGSHAAASWRRARVCPTTASASHRTAAANGNQRFPRTNGLKCWRYCSHWAEIGTYGSHNQRADKQGLKKVTFKVKRSRKLKDLTENFFFLSQMIVRLGEKIFQGPKQNRKQIVRKDSFKIKAMMFSSFSPIKGHIIYSNEETLKLWPVGLSVRCPMSVCESVSMVMVCYCCFTCESGSVCNFVSLLCF